MRARPPRHTNDSGHNVVREVIHVVYSHASSIPPRFASPPVGYLPQKPSGEIRANPIQDPSEYPRKRDTRYRLGLGWGAVKALNFSKMSFERGNITRGRDRVDQCAAAESVLGVDEIDRFDRVVFRV